MYIPINSANGRKMKAKRLRSVVNPNRPRKRTRQAWPFPRDAGIWPRYSWRRRCVGRCRPW